MYAMSIVKSTRANGEVDYWGPFPSEDHARRYITAIEEAHGKDTICEVLPIINVHQFKVTKTDPAWL